MTKSHAAGNCQPSLQSRHGARLAPRLRPDCHVEYCSKKADGGVIHGGSFCSGRAERASGGQLPQGDLGRSDRQPARVVRFRRLCLSRRADRHKVLPEQRSDRIAARRLRGLWRRLPGAAARRHRDRPPRRHQRPQDGAGAHHLPDGVRHSRTWPVAVL